MNPIFKEIFKLINYIPERFYPQTSNNIISTFQHCIRGTCFMHDSLIIIIFSTNTVTPTYHKEYYCLTTPKASERDASFKMHNYFKVSTTNRWPQNTIYNIQELPITWAIHNIYTMTIPMSGKTQNSDISLLTFLSLPWLTNISLNPKYILYSILYNYGLYHAIWRATPLALIQYYKSFHSFFHYSLFPPSKVPSIWVSTQQKL